MGGNDKPNLGKKGRRTKGLLDESEEESEKIGLKLNIQKTKIMASRPRHLFDAGFLHSSTCYLWKDGEGGQRNS